MLQRTAACLACSQQPAVYVLAVARSKSAAITKISSTNQNQQQ